MRMKASAALVGLAVAGVSMFATSSASSHGYTDNPISRQKLCANGTVTGCGNIQWEPQSVEGPKGFPRPGRPTGRSAPPVTASSPSWTTRVAATGPPPR